MKFWMLIPSLLLIGCSASDEHSQDINTVNQRIVFSGVELLSDNSLLQHFEFEVGEMATIKINGISGLSESTNGYSRLCVIHPSGDTLVEIVEQVKEKFNFLIWNFLVTPAFEPGQKYLAIADFFEESSGRTLHAEVPLAVKLSEPCRQITVIQKDSLVSSLFVRNGSLLFKDGQSPEFGEQLLMVLRINPEEDSRSMKYNLMVKDSSGETLFSDSNTTLYNKADGALSFLLLLEPAWHSKTGLSVLMQLENSLVNLNF